MRSLFKSRNQGNQRGAAAIEFAIVLPLLLLLFVGIVEFGIGYYNKQIVTNASREGARIGIEENSDFTSIEATVFEYVEDRLITFAQYSDSLVNVESEYFGTNSDYLRVKVTFNYTYLILSGFKFFGLEFSEGLNITGETAMRRF